MKHSLLCALSRTKFHFGLRLLVNTQNVAYLVVWPSCSKVSGLGTNPSIESPCSIQSILLIVSLLLSLCRGSYYGWTHLYIYLRRSRDSTVFIASCVCLLRSLHSISFGQLLRWAHKHIVNIMKVYMERKNMQPELIRFRKKYRIYSRSLFRT